MASGGLRRIFDLLFPGDDARADSSELIERGLEALRRERDRHAITMGKVKTVPSRLELRLPPALHDELSRVGGVRDVGWFLNDELMKDLRSEGLRTFGDQPVHVSIEVDPSLPSDEIYAAVLQPPPTSAPQPAPMPVDRTAILGENDAALGRSPGGDRPVRQSWRLTVVDGAALVASVGLDGGSWIIGRRGTSGRPLPEGSRKVDLDLPATVSREQVRIDLIDQDRLRIQRLGQGRTTLADGEEIAVGESRLLPPGGMFRVGNFELTISRQ